MSWESLDLFAGAGGWDEAARLLGFNPLGIEIDEAACATREAAGHRTLQGDVAKLDPQDFGPCEICIASAPCPTYSSAGKGAGRRLTDVVVRCMHEIAAGNDTRAERRQEAFEILAPVYWEEEQEKAAKKGRKPDREKSKARARRDADLSLLVVEPLRWVLALEPRYIALEQVPEVLGLWSEMATILGAYGYNCWTGVLFAETYGVPQTRKRAILMADREGRVKPPPPTHQRYVSPPKEDEDAPEGLFEVERVERVVRPEDRDLLPWVSMAEALGRDRGRLVHTQRNGSTGDYAERDADESAFTVATNADRWTYDRRQTGGDGTPVPPVPSSEPAPTLTAAGLAKGRDQWTRERPAPTLVSSRRSKDGIVVGRQLPEGESENVGGHGWDSEGEESKPKNAGDAVRVSESEALVLQSFRPDYPVQGTKNRRFLQIGNAVPPALALPILGELLGIDWKPIQADYLATYTQQVDLEEAV